MPTNDTNIIKSDEENKSFEQQYKEIFEQLDEKYNAISKDIILTVIITPLSAFTTHGVTF